MTPQTTTIMIKKNDFIRTNVNVGSDETLYDLPDKRVASTTDDTLNTAHTPVREPMTDPVGRCSHNNTAAKLGFAAAAGVVGAAVAGVGAFAMGSGANSDVKSTHDDKVATDDGVGESAANGTNRQEIEDIITGGATSDEESAADKSAAEESATDENLAVENDAVSNAEVDESAVATEGVVNDDDSIVTSQTMANDAMANEAMTNEAIANDTMANEAMANEANKVVDNVALEEEALDGETGNAASRVTVRVTATHTADEVAADDDGVEVATPADSVTDVEPDDISSRVSLSYAVNDEMSFNEAFAAARADVGAGGVFEWRGGYYGTYYKDEWAEVDDDFKSEFSNHNWAAEFDDGKDEVEIGDDLDVDMVDEEELVAEVEDGEEEIDVELIADNAEEFEMSFVLDGEASMADIMEEAYEMLPGEIIDGDFDIEIDIASVEPVVGDDAAAEELLIADETFNDDVDLLDDMGAGVDDFIC